MGVWKRDFGFRIPPHVPRWSPELQVERRATIARSRNHLLSRALDDEERVLWIDAWRDHGRLHTDELRAEGDLVPLDTVGGTMLLVRADVHRDGLIFPPSRTGSGIRLPVRTSRSSQQAEARSRPRAWA